MTTTASAEDRTAAPASLRPCPDQREHWRSFSEPMPFDEAAALILKAHRADGERDDVVVTDLRSWAFGSTDTKTMQLARVPFAGRDPGEPLPLRELAFSQLCTKLGAPAPYIRNLPVKLQVACVNYGLTRQRSPALLRLAGDEVRAVLSDRYAAADDELLLNMISDCLDGCGYRRDAFVRAAAVGPHTLLRITLPGDGVPVKVGDVFESGIDIGNSEVGLRSVQVTPVSYRLVCTNGMRAWNSEAAVRMRHIGDPARLQGQLADAIPIAFAEARGDIARWRRAVDVLIDDALDEVESLRGFGLSTRETKAVVRELAADPSGATVRQLLRQSPTTAFEIANAITAVARECTSTAARLSLEETGHRYLARRAA